MENAENEKSAKEKRIVKEIKRFFGRHVSQITHTLTAFVSIGLAILSNYFYDKIVALFSNAEPKQWLKILVLFSILLALIYLLSCLIERIKIKVFPQFMDDQYMRNAFLRIRNLGSQRQKSLQELQVTLGEETDMVEYLMREAVDNMQLIVESCYSFFDSTFSNAGQLVDDIKFEATFMTKSYQDGEITIPCSANKENRTPTSMLLRTENPKIYSETETAKVYEQTRPQMILISNTETNDDYNEIYENQKQRIKSSIVLPVMSHKNELLGTLVVHCNQAGFFKDNRYTFWNELLEMFSVELGYQKLLLDYYNKKYPNKVVPF